ncbi:MAG: caspase family protein [Xanthobacteraceae bacterium]
MPRRLWVIAVPILLGSLVPPAAADDGSDCARSGGGDETIAACSRLIASNALKGPALATAFSNRGVAYKRKGDYDRAIADYDEAIKLNPSSAIAYINRCADYNAKGAHDRAIADCNAALKLDPKNGNALNNRGFGYLQKGDLDHAIADLSEFIRLYLKFAAGYCNRGDAYLRKGELDRALADLNEAIAIDPQHTPAFTFRGLVLEKKGDRERARADFEMALSLPAAPYSSVGQSAHETARARLAALSGPQTTTLTSAAPTGPSAAPLGELGRRVALVIGNSSYTAVPALPNPRRDAQALAEALRSVGFTVTLADDLPRDQLVDALRRFAADAEKADWAVIYFAGHGIEIGGVNYLIPVDARLISDRDAQFEAVSLDQVLGAVEGAHKLRLVLLDACRENPFARQIRRTVAARSIGRGLARIEPGAGTLVAYAARDGQVALDGDGQNSPFTAALVKRLKDPGLEINKLFRLLHDDVMEATDNRQEPYTYGALPGREDFYFVAR